jgi:hypothetical protein
MLWIWLYEGSGENEQNQLNHIRHFEYVMDMKIFTLTEL